ncbi:hypothetical protein ASG25_05725 [Rhizobium sp. Leaf384]|uniref:hypothetical protein n=1 Tax=Rhizobium sp. Leaf384 TaxID=1736358 RepID=UPI000715839E|nr:hypothetical protein [Rhizobium sp. Leaf384]KQS81005.1 hypothetical protein ASG25_05725 [Rhizobium sp. Leaf384]
MIRISLDGYLFGRSGIVSASTFAPRVGLKADAFSKMLDKNYFPNPGPNRTIGGAWFISKGMEGPWWRWLRKEATDEQIADIVEIVLEGDAYARDYPFRQGVNLRDWLIDVSENNTGFRWKRFFCPNF